MLTIGRLENVNIKIDGTNVTGIAKIDSGAYGCSMHAVKIIFSKYRTIVYLDDGNALIFKTDDIKYKNIKSSTGIKEERLVAKVKLKLGNIKKYYVTNMTFTNREDMRHKILIGRKVLKNRYMIDVSKTFILGD